MLEKCLFRKWLLAFSISSLLWYGGVVVVTTTQNYSIKSKLKFYSGSNPTRNTSDLCDGENLCS